MFPCFSIIGHKLFHRLDIPCRYVTEIVGAPMQNPSRADIRPIFQSAVIIDESQLVGDISRKNVYREVLNEALQQ